jgi:hypothetical protein
MDEHSTIAWLLHHYWLAISIISTLTVVQMFKALVKHYLANLDDFARKLIIFTFAILTGYIITRFFMVGDLDRDRWAAAIAILNPVIYLLLLAYAKQKRYLWLIAILKARKFTVRGDTEKVTDEYDKTIMVNQRRREGE